MSLNVPSKIGGTLPKVQESTSPAKVQAPTPAEMPTAPTALSQRVDCFDEASASREMWREKFAEVFPQLNNLSASDFEALVAPQLESFKSQVNMVNEQKNVVANGQSQKWAGSTPVLQQTEDSNCGAAAAAMLVRSKGGKQGLSDAQLMGALESQFSSKEGTTPKQLAKMLAHEGIEVKKGSGNFDKGALDAALRNGNKAVAMVDSNKISTREGAPSSGKPHWVVIDGMDDKGRYMVKDPGSASTYFVEPDEMENAISAGRNSHQGGGMLLVENTLSTAPEPVLAAEGAEKAEVLGNTPGGGSMTRGFGRESS